MKRYGLMILGIALMFGACRDEDEIGPIVGEKDWFVLEDSDDPIDGQRYEIYKEFGIPVYYNDTIGSETRYAVSGEPYTYYECLKVFYNPGGDLISGRYTLLEDKNDTQEVLTYLQTELLPKVPESFYIPSVLLVDSLVVGTDSLAYKGFNTVVCAKVKEFAGMDAENKQWWIGGVMSAMVSGNLLNNESAWLEENFYAKSLAVVPEANQQYVYSETRQNRVSYAYAQMDVPDEEKTLGSLGFLNHKWRPTLPTQTEKDANTPNKEGDLKQYCEAIFALSVAEFTERWGEYPVVMEKYEAMKGKLEEYGFVIE